MVFVFPSLVYFTLCNTFKVCPCDCECQAVFLCYRCIIFHLCVYVCVSTHTQPIALFFNYSFIDRYIGRSMAPLDKDIGLGRPL